MRLLFPVTDVFKENRHRRLADIPQRRIYQVPFIDETGSRYGTGRPIPEVDPFLLEDLTACPPAVIAGHLIVPRSDMQASIVLALLPGLFAGDGEPEGVLPYPLIDGSMPSTSVDS